MSIWLWIGLLAYFTGVAIAWQQFQPKIAEWEEYSNFPVIWTVKLAIAIGYFLKSLIWFYDLILDDEASNKKASSEH
ncbi:hypothetical protein [Brunnivagina elsteri]|uniref:Uncharacterized protein n=1 Tax=Brunnivagina elsteri CCALA 953 TaxID=987040 RepID=A0A2A2TP93_9CYAN|nr:hypothetical protein [Calothrix elsteri]PAX60252.1 hypothetical protein CK510_02670 [Calothrix elsteri CCALA 953]